MIYSSIFVENDIALIIFRSVRGIYQYTFNYYWKPWGI